MNRIGNITSKTFATGNARFRYALASWKSSRLFPAALFLIILVCALTSLGQIMLHKEAGKGTFAAGIRSLVLDNPVFNPIVPSYLRTFQLNPGATVAYRPDSSSSTPLSLEGSWWDAEVSPEMEPASPVSVPGIESSVPEKAEYHGSRTREFLGGHAAGSDFLGIGVADLLAVLRDRETRWEKGELNTNPFDEALQDSSSQSASDKKKKADDSKTDTATQDRQKKTDNNATDAASERGTDVQTARSFLIIGRFDNQSVSIAQATAQAPLLNQSGNHAAVFDVSGTRQAYDLNLVLRSRDNRESIAFADLNGDGFLDLAVTNRTTSQTTAYLNDGYGSFIPCRTISDGLGPSMTAIADFSGDGSMDVAVMLQAEQRIIVDGKGLRKFIFYPSTPVASEYSFMLPHDFDGDGAADLLLTSLQTATATVYRNQGQARFAASENYPLQAFPLLQAGVDFGRGITDTVFVQNVGNQLSIALRNGADGTVGSLANTILDSSIYYIVGDFDQDGVVDIAIAHRE